MRRRRALLAATLVLAVGYAGSGAVTSMLDGGRGRVLSGDPIVPRESHRMAGSSLQWPVQGQAALVLGTGRSVASPYEQPAPIASLAKVMTAYLTLKRYPLTGTERGFNVTITAAEAQAEADNLSDGQSGVAVQAGEQLDERQLLEALLIPSGNNIAEILADQVAGSQSRFVTEMNAEALALGMRHTIYADPSGFEPTTVSTAADQLRVFLRAMRFQAFRQIVSRATVTLPVAGTLTNFNPLISEGYAGKTGSDSAAGGCLAFLTDATADGRRQTAVGVVMGQGQGSDTSALLAAAGQAALQLVASATHTTHSRQVTAPRTERN